jgi:hypothetical protein
MAAGHAWVLNLDADLELAAGARYQPTRRVLSAMAAPRAALARALLGPDDLLVDEDTAIGAAAGRRGRAFCPTPRALVLLRRAGAIPDPAPTLDVLRRVNGRAFCAGLPEDGDALEGASFVETLDDARAKLATAPPPAIARAWRIKRAHGMAGRAQRVVTPGALDDGEFAFLRAGIAEGGVQIEPNVEIVEELAMHGVIAPPDAPAPLRIGRLVRQRCDARGAWIETEPLSDPELASRGEIARVVTAELTHVAAALAEAGYFGPFGVDAFTYRATDERRPVRLRARGEINARLSMGFVRGFEGPPP